MTDPAPGPHRPDLHPFELAQARHAVLVRLVRLTFLVTFVTITLLMVLGLGEGPMRQTVVGNIAVTTEWRVILAIGSALIAAVLLIDYLTPHRKISTLFSVFVGLVAAMLATAGLSYVIDLIAHVHDVPSQNIVAITKLLLGIAVAYLCVTTVLQTQDDFRLVIPYVEFAKQIRGPRPLLVDTSILIDGRIVELCATGIVQYPVIIPGFVVNELHTLADSQDKMKRARGRRGLDVIQRLQRTSNLDISIDNMLVAGQGVDRMLIELAREMPATLVTTDFALSRIAGIQGITAVNLHDIAAAVKPSLAVGEHISLKIVKAGEQPGQGVGYLEDGTMVVAEDGGGRVGQQVTLVVASSLQTSAGRLLFARLAEPSIAANTEPVNNLAISTPPHHQPASHAHAGDGSGPMEQPSAAPSLGVSAPSSTTPPNSSADEPGANGQGPAPTDSAPRGGSPSSTGPAGPSRPGAGPYPPRSPARPNPYRNPRR